MPSPGRILILSPANPRSDELRESEAPVGRVGGLVELVPPGAIVPPEDGSRGRCQDAAPINGRTSRSKKCRLILLPKAACFGDALL
jgi:hypothetical protein